MTTKQAKQEFTRFVTNYRDYEWLLTQVYKKPSQAKQNAFSKICTQLCYINKFYCTTNQCITGSNTSTFTVMYGVRNQDKPWGDIIYVVKHTAYNTYVFDKNGEQYVFNALLRGEI